MAARPKQQSDDEVNGEKRNAYPLYGLKKAIQVAGIVAELGGAKMPVQRSLIAQRLQVDESAAALTQSLGATKTFALIQGRGSYHLTFIGKQYFFPETPREKQVALLTALAMPTIFESLIKRFDGAQVPTAETLVNILKRNHDVTESWQPRLASLFLASCREAGVIDSAGFLRYAATIQATLNDAVRGNMEAMNTAVQSPPQQTAPSQPYVATAPSQMDGTTPVPTYTIVSTTWCHQGLRVETPEPLTPELWKKLVSYVNVLKPQGGSEENN